MDFLKACKTNIHAVENVSHIKYRLYTARYHAATLSEQWSLLQSTTARLRAENVLCAVAGVRLFVFADANSNHIRSTDTLHDDFDTAEESTIGHTDVENAGGSSVRHVFQAAIELCLAYNMARNTAIVHIGPWTWLYRNGYGAELDHMDSIVITLRTRTTATDGFYLISNITPAPFAAMDLDRSDPHGPLILAPFAQSARLLSTNSRKSLIADEAWKANVAQVLRAQAIHLPNDVEWLTVELLDENSSACVWPAHLCFMPSDQQNGIAETSSEDHDWWRWFISPEEGAIFRNPLAMTEEWYKSAADRESAVAVVDAPAPVEASTTDHGHGTATSDVTLSNAEMEASPPFPHRGIEHNSAMAGIYPTPPDGFAPGQSGAQHAGVTPSVTQPELNASVVESSPSYDITSKLPTDPPPFTNESGEFGIAQEDLFGDVEEIGFGDAEIDDADFSFFDEPDDDFAELSPMHDRSMPDAPIYDAVDSSDAVHPPDSSVLSNPGVLVEALSTTYTSQIESAHSATATSDSPKPKPHEADSNPPSSTEQSSLRPKRPLSPFGIRERLLPPPVPASHTQGQSGCQDMHSNRRDSSFTPITFRDTLGGTSRYTAALVTRSLSQDERGTNPVSINLAPSRAAPGRRDAVSDSEGEDNNDSDEDMYESSSSEVDEVDQPPPLPWEIKKRKRPAEEEAICAASHEALGPPDHDDENYSDPDTRDRLVEVLHQYMSVNMNLDIMSSLPLSGKFQPKTSSDTVAQSELWESMPEILPPIEKAYNLSKSDLVCVAQLVAEQSITTNLPGLTIANYVDYADDPVLEATMRYVRDQLSAAIQGALPGAIACDLAELALSREALLRQATNPGKAPHGQPRPQQRFDSTQTGPDFFPLPSPYLKLQRGTDAWEMLPACIHFWEPLNLGPAAGPKHLRAFCVFPFNEDLQRLLDHFLSDMGTAYENCKLGTHVHLRNASELDEQDNFEDGMAPVELSGDASLEAALRAYASTCADLGKALSSIARQEGGDRAIVVYIFNPFTAAYARQHLCACFWLLFHAYRENMPQAQWERGVNDIFLQLLPVNLVASYNTLVPFDARRMSVLAREIYDRCPPTSALQLSNISAPLPNLAAPAIELASTAPKRLGFQLAPEASGDILYEGSVLHLAYACSSDAKWLTASWIDSTGKYQSSSSFGLTGRTFAETANEVWEHTRSIMAVRQVLWRVFIVAQDATIDASILQCWRTIAAKPRAQPVCVTMLSIQSSPLLQLHPPCADPEQPCQGGIDNGFLTPASTPQSATFTSSPDVSGHGSNAPLTPAPCETATSFPTDNVPDPDAQLMDMTDETWGAMLTPKLSGSVSIGNLAHGVLFQRGKVPISDTEPVDAVAKLPSLGVSLHWTIQVKTQGTVDEGSVKQAEMTLREVLRMYRGLALLTKARGLENSMGSFAPLHSVMAAMGAAGLDGLLPHVDDT